MSAEVAIPSSLQSGLGQGIPNMLRITQVMSVEVTMPSSFASPFICAKEFELIRLTKAITLRIPIYHDQDRML